MDLDHHPPILRYRIECNRRFWKKELALLAPVLVIAVLWFSVTVIDVLCSDESWRGGLFLGGLALYCLHGFQRYTQQREEDREVEEYWDDYCDEHEEPWSIERMS